MGQMKVKLAPYKVEAVSGSGLVNPKLRDWTKVTLPTTGPTVVCLGTNDAPRGGPKWKKEYSDRVAGLMKKSKPMLWVLPARTGSKLMDLSLDSTRKIIMEQAKIHNVDTLDLRVLLNEEQEHNPDMHSKDKVHLNRQGIQRVSEAIKKWVSGN